MRSCKLEETWDRRNTGSFLLSCGSRHLKNGKAKHNEAHSLFTFVCGEVELNGLRNMQHLQTSANDGLSCQICKKVSVCFCEIFRRVECSPQLFQLQAQAAPLALASGWAAMLQAACKSPQHNLSRSVQFGTLWKHAPFFTSNMQTMKLPAVRSGHLLKGGDFHPHSSLQCSGFST